MELRHIRYFLALADELNFSRAAEKLHISQPPLSRQIQELEEQLGAKLFYRTKRHVELTDAGKAFLTKAHLILEQVEEAYISTRLSSAGKEGSLRIGFTGAVHDLIPTMKEYRKRYPNIDFILKHLSTTEQTEALNENRIDLGFVSTPIDNDKIRTIPIKKMHFVAALPKEHSLASKTTISLHDLKNETFIMTTKATGALYYDKFMEIFKAAEFQPNISIQADDLHTVLTLVKHGIGVTLTPSPYDPDEGIVMRKVENIDVTIMGMMAWHQENRSEVLKAFLEFFFEFYRDELEELG